MSANPDQQGSSAEREPPSGTYSADAQHAKGLQVGKNSTQINHFYRGGRLTRWGVFTVAVTVVLLLSGGIAGSMALLSKSESLGPPEIMLEPYDRQGPNPFMPAAPQVYQPKDTLPVVELPRTRGSAAGQPYSGDTEGLYGAIRGQIATDRDELVAFYQSHPDEARIAAEALSGDASVEWSRGKQLGGTDLAQYLLELTPVVVRVDLRVTNYSLVDGRAVPHQSILRAGTAVLVDRMGAPRFRSLSGSPLTLPTALSHAPEFTGLRWPGFEEQRVATISPSTTPLTLLTLIDLQTGLPFERQVGTTGSADTDHPLWPNSSAPTVVPTQPAQPTTTTSPTKAPNGEIDVTGIWVLASEFGGAQGTLTRQNGGFHYHTDTDSGGTVHIGWDCDLNGQPGQVATMTCTSDSSIGTSATWTATGTITVVQRNGRTKFEFEGRTDGSLGVTTMTLKPE